MEKQAIRTASGALAAGQTAKSEKTRNTARRSSYATTIVENSIKVGMQNMRGKAKQISAKKTKPNEYECALKQSEVYQEIAQREENEFKKAHKMLENLKRKS